MQTECPFELSGLRYNLGSNKTENITFVQLKFGDSAGGGSDSRNNYWETFIRYEWKWKFYLWTWKVGGVGPETEKTLPLIDTPTSASSFIPTFSNVAENRLSLCVCAWATSIERVFRPRKDSFSLSQLTDKNPLHPRSQWCLPIDRKTQHNAYMQTSGNVVT